jgi:hypothetical protein
VSTLLLFVGCPLSYHCHHILRRNTKGTVT